MPDTRLAAVDQPAPDDVIGFFKAITDGRNRSGVCYHRGDSKCQLGPRLDFHIASSAVMSCITACMPARID
jgi:hypothetical protein